MHPTELLQNINPTAKTYIMKTPPRSHSCFITLISLASALPLSAATLIDYTFGGTDIGPGIQQVSNGLGTGSTDTATGVINTGNNTGGSGDGNGNFGFNSSSLVSTTSFTGFTATFEISSITLNSGTVAELGANGLLFGVVAGPNATGTAGTNLWSNTPIAFGYLPGSGSFGDHQVAFNAGWLA